MLLTRKTNMLKHLSRFLKLTAAAWLTLGLLSACQSLSHPPLKIVDYVDLNRFTGDWYVIASIPTFIEKEAYNARENYQLNDDGTIATTFTFNEGGFDGELKLYQPTGYVFDQQSNAIWGMQFIWPIKADYRVMYLDENYQTTIIAREKRDYVWIMARTPTISETRYQNLVQRVAEQGYDTELLRKVPQQDLSSRG